MTKDNNDSNYDAAVGLRELNKTDHNDNAFRQIAGKSDIIQRRGEIYKEEESGAGDEEGDIATATTSEATLDGNASNSSSRSCSMGMLHFVQTLLPKPSSHVLRKKGRKRKTTTQVFSSFANDDDDNDDSRKIQRLLSSSLLELGGGESGLSDSNKDGCDDVNVNDAEKSKKYDDTSDIDDDNHKEDHADVGSDSDIASMTQSDDDRSTVHKQKQQQRQQQQRLKQELSLNQQNQEQQHKHLVRHQELQQQRQHSQQQLRQRFHGSNDSDGELEQRNWQQQHNVLTPEDSEKYSGDNIGKNDTERTESPQDNAFTMIAAGDEVGEGEEKSSDKDGVIGSATPIRPILGNQKLENHSTQQQTAQQRQLQPTQIQQPPGWRVKLYRLNIDGTWDDCGTGRIQFYFARPQQPNQYQKLKQQPPRKGQQEEDLGSGEGSIDDDQKGEDTPSLSPLHSSPSSSYSSFPSNSTFHELGEPMLCMRAEIPLAQEQDDKQQQGHQTDNVSNISGDNRNKSSMPTLSHLRVLLRTRVLLHDSAYQCQGGNIITWCEPFEASQQKLQNEPDDGPQSHLSSSSTSTIVTGVDLALSFQDNAGCKDIWQNIADVQVRARELLKSNSVYHHEMATNLQQTHAWDEKSCDAAGKNSHNSDQQIGRPKNSIGVVSDGRVVGGHHAQQKVQHLHLQDHSPLSSKHHSPPQPQHHYHCSLHISPNSPDHDAMEDQQLSLVSAGGGHQSLSLPPRPPFLLVKASAPSASLSSSGGTREGETMHHEKQDLNNGAYDYTHDYISNNKNESSFSLENHHEDMMAVSMAAAAAAASYRTGDGCVKRPASPAIDRNNNSHRECDVREVLVDSDNSSALLYDRIQEKNRPPLQPLPQEFQNEQQGNRDQHCFSPGNTNDSDKDSNDLPISRLSLPSNKPTWNDIPSLREYIANFQYGGGVGGYQTINASLLQREELLVYLASDDCSNLKKLLRLFHSGKVDQRGKNDDESTIIYSGSRPEEEDYRLLAGIIKSILLLNDPEIIEYVTTDASTFELLCAILDYDPELRTKANHIDFLSKHAKFHTVVPMDDAYSYGELAMNIHRLFRMNYLRDVILRPTLDESNLSALVSLGQFTMNDVIRGVMARRLPMIASAVKEEVQSKVAEHDESTQPTSRGNEDENYFTRIIRVLGTEIHFIQNMVWKEGYDEGGVKKNTMAFLAEETLNDPSEPTTVFPPSKTSNSEIWQQHVAPQDSSLPSRMIRRKGCLMFLNELFNMARMSLQQHEKDDFIEVAVGTTISLLLENNEDVNGSRDRRDASSSAMRVVNCRESDDEIDNIENRDPRAHPIQHAISSVLPSQGIYANLLSLLSAILSDPTTDAKERGAALDILSVISMHDPSLIRKHCLDFTASTASVVAAHQAVHRPEPNNLQEVLFACSPDDLILALLFVMATEVDAGLLLQTSEIIRVVLDSEMVTEQFGGGPSTPQGSAEGGEFSDEEYDINVAYMSGNNGQPSLHEHLEQFGGGGGRGGEAKSTESEHNTFLAFLALFYDRYVHWLAAPFQFAILVPRLTPPTSINEGVPSKILRHAFAERTSTNTRSTIGCIEDADSSSFFCPVTPCPVRESFTLEILCFCVRAHVHRMKFFVLRSRMLIYILKMLSRHEEPLVTGPMLPSGIRCLKLASLKLLRSVLSVKDEFYHRHIIQYNLFTPVFDLFRERSKSLGNDLISSAILEMCDFICQENIKSLIDYIFTQHLSPKTLSSSSAIDDNKITSSLEDVGNPHVTTFQQLRIAYMKNHNLEDEQRGKDPSLRDGDHHNNRIIGSDDDLVANGSVRSTLNKIALEDQRKFQQADEDDSYFNEDDDGDDAAQ